MNIPFPRLLDAATMQEVRRITPISAAVNLGITPLSTATLVVDIDDDIPLRSYVEMFTAEGSAGIYRVREIQSEYCTRNIKTLLLEHAICELADFFHSTTDTVDLDNTVYGAINTLFQYFDTAPTFRHHWEIGTVESTATVVQTFSTSNSDGLSDLLDIMEQIPDYYLAFDQTALPWKLNVVKRPSTVTAEGRLSRNVRSAVVRQDDRDWLNRSVAVVYDGEEVAGIYSAEDAGLIAEYGRVNRIEVMEDGTTAAQANRFVARTLAKYKEFKVSVSIEAADLAQITGETLDSFKIGKKFRLAIDNFVKEETITEISWRDVYNDPTAVSITLAEPPEKVTKILHRNDKGKVSKKKKA